MVINVWEKETWQREIQGIEKNEERTNTTNFFLRLRSEKKIIIII